MIKGILFDYGGTIDTNGRHWANVLWEAYKKNKVSTDKEQFMEAYAFGEKALAIYPIIRPDHRFSDVLLLKLQQQFQYLKLSDEEYKIPLLVADCMQVVQSSLKHAHQTLEHLANTYPLVMVSNFYGNIQTVLTEFGINAYFSSIVESAVVGVRKPDPAIYELGVKALGFLAHECVVIGDSYRKDIVPAKQVGCKTIWINVDGFEEDYKGAALEAADRQITDFVQIPDKIKEL